MNSLVRFLFIGALAALPLIGNCDDMKLSFTFEITSRTTYATMDELSSSMLDDPYTLAEIKVKRSQLGRLPFRNKINHTFEMIAVGQSTHVDVSESDKAVFAAEAIKRAKAPTGLLLSDLSSEQQKKLQHIALRDRPMDALFTKEVDFAIRLSADQKKRLGTIRSEYWTRCEKIEGKHTQGEWMIKEMKKIEDTEDSLSPSEKLSALGKLCTKMEVWMGQVWAKIEQPISEATQAANKRALGVLTKAQTKTYAALRDR